MAEKESEWPPTVRWVMGIAAALIISGVVGFDTARRGMQGDLYDIRTDLAVLTATVSENIKSISTISAFREAVEDERYKDIAVRIDRLEHNVNIIAAKLEDDLPRKK